jgi:hypothetical protein
MENDSAKKLLIIAIQIPTLMAAFLTNLLEYFRRAMIVGIDKRLKSAGSPKRLTADKSTRP